MEPCPKSSISAALCINITMLCCTKISLMPASHCPEVHSRWTPKYAQKYNNNQKKSINTKYIKRYISKKIINKIKIKTSKCHVLLSIGNQLRDSVTGIAQCAGLVLLLVMCCTQISLTRGHPECIVKQEVCWSSISATLCIHISYC